MKKLLMMMGVTVLCACGIAQVEKMKALYNGLSEEELCRVLEEKFDDLETVEFIMRKFYLTARAYRIVPPHPQVLYWARRVAKEKPEKTSSPAQAYLARKGDARDLDLVSRVGRDILLERVAGTNVLDGSDHPFYIPSVSNMGPQGVYAEALFWQYWENMEGRPSMTGGRPLKHPSEVPPEIMALAVWFDDDGNPVCNVDLAKYGLTMPELDVPNRPKGKTGMRDEESGIKSEKSRMRRLLPYALILPAALAALLLTRRRKR